MEAQRYPSRLRRHSRRRTRKFLVASGFQLRCGTRKPPPSNPASYIPASKLPAIAHAVVEACDAQDGVKDGILNDPRQCHFEPKSMLCKAGDSDSCLTAAASNGARANSIGGAKDAQGHQIFPGFLPGGGRRWRRLGPLDHRS